MEPVAEQLSTDQIISAVSRLSLPELEQVFSKVLAIQAERRATHFSTEESALMDRINQSLPPELRDRLRILQSKREDSTINDTEYEELTKLIDRSEELHAERMSALVSLAKLRGVSLPILMEQLNIQVPENV